MKKCFQLTIAVFLIVGLLTKCQTPLVNNRVESINEHTPLRKLQEKVMVEILNLAKEDQFRQYILAECLKQKHGDYNVYITDIIASHREIDKYKKSMATLEQLVGLIKPLVNDNEPLVFYPRAETIEDERIDHPEARSAEVIMSEPLGVIQPVESPLDGQSTQRVSYAPEGVDAYRAYVNGTWVWVQTVDEEFAWENDIYVIGNEENVSAGNMVQNNLRVDGRAEYGGIIQVTDINAIEHWTSGKLEFKMIIIGASGSPSQNIPFGKRKRKNFRNNNWYDFGYFVGNWNKSTYGNWMTEAWIEEDGGASASTTITFPSTSGGPAIGYTFPSQDQDDKLGQFTVQFDDAVGQVYNIQNANVKRK